MSSTTKFASGQIFARGLSVSSLESSPALPAPRASLPWLTEDEGARFLRIVAGSLRITRHYELFLWLNGELQQFVPHQILISAWGDFAKWNLKLDLVSRLPGVRTEQLARCRIDGFLKRLHSQWVEAGRWPLLVKAAEVVGAPPASCSCHVHSALSTMRCVLVHGVRDARGGHESLYVALGTGSFARGRSRERFLSLVDSLTAQIDVAFRKVAAYPLEESRAEGEDGERLELSSREEEIIDWVWRGVTNADIATALEISPFTVKNHVQRIFRKIGVSNRTQAAAKYSESLREPRPVE
jgi:transcriptional regulator EpsA